MTLLKTPSGPPARVCPWPHAGQCWMPVSGRSWWRGEGPECPGWAALQEKPASQACKPTPTDSHHADNLHARSTTTQPTWVFRENRGGGSRKGAPRWHIMSKNTSDAHCASHSVMATGHLISVSTASEIFLCGFKDIRHRKDIRHPLSWVYLFQSKLSLGRKWERQPRGFMFFARTCDLGLETRCQVLYRTVLPKKQYPVLDWLPNPKQGGKKVVGLQIFLRTDLGFGLLKASSLQNRWLQPQTLAGSTVKGIVSPHPFACW